ncbi:hypothetical protein [Candidatus Methylobacter oryzae]|uniref:DUF2975 domain-containing protein n=1 Tax=Candidatus Methylobacter oryzae TaxID=2497749 RepID=A0ABY3CG68_9GAMM|nr:hypothetical protein [Candidatus Methylobacter oryzae]TRX02894.1 hypothetical protein EKO24_001005 [Candidatus Methylobacter oryzae]
MNFSANHPSVEAPASGRSLTAMIWLWLGLLGAPVAWVAQLLLSEPFAAYACYPYDVPLSAPILKNLPAVLIGINAGCFALAALSGFAVWRSRQRFGYVQPGEDRNRFLVKLSLLSSFIFIVAVIFNICAVFLVPPCRPWF